MGRKTSMVLMGLALACMVCAAETNTFKWGGDVRLRTVYFDHTPYTIGTDSRGGANSFQRYRTRLWGEYHATENLFFRGRLVNEFRTFQNDTHVSTGEVWDPLDEVVFDNLFVDYRLDNLAFRIGRQDLIYGTGKLILDGTPKDGSRTIYINAAKASYTGIEDTTIDLLAIYTPSEDELAINRQNRDINGKTGGYYDGNESGGGVYAKNKAIANLPFEAYYLVKTEEEEWARPAVGGTPGAGIAHDGKVRHTIGTRLMPKLSESLDANLEIAFQTGNSISAYMVDSQLNWHLPALGEQKGKLALGWYHLSGDDPGTNTDESWNPLWARWPQYSELYIYAYDTDGAGRWSNLSMPHLDLTIAPCKAYKADLLLGYMFAPEADAGGGGHNRGWLFTWWNRFTLKEQLFTKADKLGAHILLELMEAGNYYADDQQGDLAIFSRAELNYSF
ncbi:MAG: alginate export family protein [Kiritimatiellales bacterium]|nr:alginate export family protein [Kiritimatiellales bacterium]